MSMEVRVDTLLERCGFIRCQIEMTEFILEKEKQHYEMVVTLRQKIEKEKSLVVRQELLKDLAELAGQSKLLRELYHYVSALKAHAPSANVDC